MDCSARHILFRLIKAIQLCFFGLCILIVSCSSVPQPEDLVEQYLDEETLVSISRMTDPIAFYRSFGTNNRIDQRTSTEFAYVAPFEINHMGNYKLYLWAALPTHDTIGRQTTAAVNNLIMQLDYELLVFESAIHDWRDLNISDAVYDTRIGSENGSIFELTQEQLSLILGSEEIYLSVAPVDTLFSTWNDKAKVNTGLIAFRKLIEF